MILPEPIIASAQIVFVILFVLRTLRKFSAVFFLRKSSLTKIGTAYVFTSVILILGFSSDHFLFFLPSLICFLFPIFLKFFFVKRFEMLCHKGFPVFSDNVVLEMNCGKSFRSAVRSALPHLPESVGAFIQKNLENSTAENLLAPRFFPTTAQKYANELLKIDRFQANQLLQMRSLRDLIYLENNFRHKSGHALLQTRLQASIILILYALVFIFSTYQHPWSRLKLFFAASLTMMVLGILLLNLLTRKRKWKT